MRVLGIDFGEARIGLAISDHEARLAVPLTTLERTSDGEAIAHIGAVVAEEGVELLVIGEPRNLDGTLGERARRVRSFLRKLRRTVQLPCELVDERLTTVEARQRLQEAGVDTRRFPERIDAVAAQILLQQYLDEQVDFVHE